MDRMKAAYSDQAGVIKQMAKLMKDEKEATPVKKVESAASVK